MDRSTCCYCGLHLGRHTFQDADGEADAMCWGCVIQLLADVERVGTSLRVSVIPAAIPAAIPGRVLAVVR